MADEHFVRVSFEYWNKKKKKKKRIEREKDGKIEETKRKCDTQDD